MEKVKDVFGAARLSLLNGKVEGIVKARDQPCVWEIKEQAEMIEDIIEAFEAESEPSSRHKDKLIEKRWIWPGITVTMML